MKYQLVVTIAERDDCEPFTDIEHAKEFVKHKLLEGAFVDVEQVSSTDFFYDLTELVDNEAASLELSGTLWRKHDWQGSFFMREDVEQAWTLWYDTVGEEVPPFTDEMWLKVMKNELWYEVMGDVLTQEGFVILTQIVKELATEA